MQMALMHETINDAVREAIQACGGFKRVGPMLWPERPVDEASNRLRDCLNPDRRDRLTPEQLLFVLRLARQSGCHAAATFLMAECGYAPPVPVDPEDQLARQEREFVEATKALQKLAAQMVETQARIEQRSKLRAV